MTRILLALLVLLAACAEPSTPLPLACTKASHCPSGFHCDPTGHCKADVPCTSDEGCCLGERCEDLRCRPRQNCSPKSVCGEAGTVCLHGLCVPAACSDASPCPPGRTCRWGRCQAKLPCGGHCPDGRACAALIDRCVALRGPLPACPVGELPVLANEPELLLEGCSAMAEKVECRALPPLPEGEIGLPGVVVYAQGALLHVSYDRTYGDLVLARHGSAPPFARTSLQVLAGLPQAAPVIGDPTGPRQGIAAPGPDVGSRLDAMVDPTGRLHAAFRDDSEDALRYLALRPDGSTAAHVVLQGGGVGAAVALTVDPQGRPLIAAFTPAGAKSPSRLTLLRAKSSTPLLATDWVGEVLAQEPAPTTTPPCGATCPTGQTCAKLPAGTPACVTVASDCTACLPWQVCGPKGACYDALAGPAPVDDGPVGRGAWLDVLATPTGVAVAAYAPPGPDPNATGNLVLWRGEPASASQPTGGKWTQRTFLSSDIPGGSKDFGRFVSMVAADPGLIWLAFEDTAAGRLLAARELASGTWKVEVLDDGHRPDGHHRVGADVSLARHLGGGLLATYQDTRRADLLVAMQAKPGGPIQRKVLETTEAAGFSPGAVQLGSKAWAVLATTLRVDAGGRLRAQVVGKELVWSGE